jgi:hypothetical protein
MTWSTLLYSTVINKLYAGNPRLCFAANTCTSVAIAARATLVVVFVGEAVSGRRHCRPGIVCTVHEIAE